MALCSDVRKDKLIGLTKHSDTPDRLLSLLNMFLLGNKLMWLILYLMQEQSGCWLPIHVQSAQTVWRSMGDLGQSTDGILIPLPPSLGIFAHLFCFVHSKWGENFHSYCRCEITSGFPAAQCSVCCACLPVVSSTRQAYQKASCIMCCALGTLWKAINSFHCASLWTIKAF